MCTQTCTSLCFYFNVTFYSAIFTVDFIVGKNQGQISPGPNTHRRRELWTKECLLMNQVIFCWVNVKKNGILNSLDIFRK